MKKPFEKRPASNETAKDAPSVFFGGGGGFKTRFVKGQGKIAISATVSYIYDEASKLCMDLMARAMHQE